MPRGRGEGGGNRPYKNRKYRFVEFRSASVIRLRVLRVSTGVKFTVLFGSVADLPQRSRSACNLLLALITHTHTHTRRPTCVSQPNLTSLSDAQTPSLRIAKGYRPLVVMSEIGAGPRNARGEDIAERASRTAIVFEKKKLLYIYILFYGN